MGRNKRELRIKVTGVRRKEPDARRMARAIVRLTVEMDTEQAQALADALEHEEALQRRSITRARSALRAESDAEKPERSSTTHRKPVVDEDQSGEQPTRKSA